MITADEMRCKLELLGVGAWSSRVSPVGGVGIPIRQCPIGVRHLVHSYRSHGIGVVKDSEGGKRAI